jgi:hypothetical protein
MAGRPLEPFAEAANGFFMRDGEVLILFRNSVSPVAVVYQIRGGKQTLRSRGCRSNRPALGTR